VDPIAGLDDVEKRKFLTLQGLELDPSVVQPVATRYTDYAIPALCLMIVPQKNVKIKNLKEDGENCITRSFTICTLNQILLG
jgi:hypothetical protein